MTKKFTDSQLSGAFANVSDIHPDAHDALERMLGQTGQRDMLYAVGGDDKVCAAITAREGRLLHPQGAVVIDCTGLKGRDLVFGESGYANGPLAQAWEAGRPVVLQNFGNLQAGSGGELQTVFQFFSGEVTDCKFYNALGGEPYSFDVKDRKDSFRLRVTSQIDALDDQPNSLKARMRTFYLHDDPQSQGNAVRSEAVKSMLADPKKPK